MLDSADTEQNQLDSLYITNSKSHVNGHELNESYTCHRLNNLRAVCQRECGSLS